MFISFDSFSVVVLGSYEKKEDANTPVKLKPQGSWVPIYQDRMMTNFCICERVNAMISEIWRYPTLVNWNPASFHAAFYTRVDRSIEGKEVREGMPAEAAGRGPRENNERKSKMYSITGLPT